MKKIKKKGDKRDSNPQYTAAPRRCYEERVLKRNYMWIGEPLTLFLTLFPSFCKQMEYTIEFVLKSTFQKYRDFHLKLPLVIDHNFWTNKDRAKWSSLKWTIDLGKTDGWRRHPSGTPYAAEKGFCKSFLFAMKSSKLLSLIDIDLQNERNQPCDLARGILEIVWKQQLGSDLKDPYHI